MVATIGAIGTLIGGLSSAAGVLGRTNQQQDTKAGLAAAQLQDARNNEAYQQAISALINQRSVAGFTDAFGSSLRYDPATNQWVSDLGALPKAEQTAASQAAISRNTTDLQTAQDANRMAMQRASAALPGYDQALRAMQNFRPMGSDALTGLLTQQATTANNNVIRPIIADTLRNFSRTGSAAGDVLGKLGRTSYENLRDALVNSRIQALTTSSQINNQNRQGLEGQASTFAGLTNPNLQFSSVVPSDQSKTMAALLGNRAQTASTAPAYGAAGVNNAVNAAGGATSELTKNLPDPNFRLNSATGALSDLAGTLKDSNVQSTLAGLFGNSSDFNQKVKNFQNQDIGFGPGNTGP